MTGLKVGIVTKEWPPAIYGGAGVHVLQLTQALRTIKDVHVDVHCFGGKRDDAFGYSLPDGFADANPAVQALAIDLEMAHILDMLMLFTHTLGMQTWQDMLHRFSTESLTL